MTFAEDEVYKYIKQNMSKFHVIRVEQMLPFVSASLSVPDVEEIRAVLNSRGNHVAVWDFIDFLRRRNGWVEVFLNALHQANFWALEEEVQRVYEAMQVRPAVPSSHQATRSPSSSSLACSQTSPPAESPGSQGSGIASPLPRKPVTPASCPPSIVASDSAAEGFRDPTVEMPEKVPEWIPAPPRQVLSPQQMRNISVGAVQASYRGSDPGNISLPPLDSQQNRREVPAGQAGLVELDMPSEQTQSWPSRQQQPVCVNNGYFGNMNHLSSGAGSKVLVTGRSAPREEPRSAKTPNASRNEPEEVSFVSIDCSPPPGGAAREGQGDRPLAGDSLQEDKRRALAGYVNESVACSTVDVRSPLLIQKQFDVEQKQAQMLQDGGGDADLQHHTAAPALAADPQQLTSTPVPSNAPLAKSQPFAGPPSTTKLLHLSNSGLAGESLDASSFPSSAARSPLSSGSAHLACDSSLDKMKTPIQETKLPEGGKSSSNFSVLPQKEVVQTPQPPHSDVSQAKPEISGSMRNASPQNPAGMTRNMPDICRSYQVFCSREEEQLSKPGMLCSTHSELPEQPACRQPSSQDTDPEYSGRSDRFLLSDPIMMSSLSTTSSDPGGACNLQPEESRSSSFSKPHQLPSAAVSGPEKDEVPQIGRSTYQSLSSSWDAADVRTHEIHVTNDPSLELEDAVDPRDRDSTCRTSPASASPDLSGGRPSHEAGSSTQPDGPWSPTAPLRDSGHNANQPRGDGAEDASPYLGLAMAVAFFSVAGLMLYKHLNN
ncbi:PREDICTED: mitochondrial antiviral-signaling protein [Gavialis gangeticus]|uniref:mitochondrial antiviral-signaling protein n=1 Tax=Gavialis gangeticus TaxID=94835 RepID=UPI00092E41FE|nr:PREDICTED: mitochondrial antiviral-signaling protein [Gavialis gangeticus]